MTSVADLFAHAGVRHSGAVRWGEPVSLARPGVYVVSTTEDPHDLQGVAECPLDRSAISELLRARPEATVDGRAATPELLAERLMAMWPTGEPVVYVGLAGTDTGNRVDQFYKTRIGARAPHAGGWPVKMLDSERLWVHYGPAQDPTSAESAMVRRFAAGVPAQIADRLVDPAAPLPFANLTYPAGRRKRHGLSGVKELRSTVGRLARVKAHPDSAGGGAVPLEPRAPSTVGSARLTQNVTASDIRNGQLRVPRVTKSILPTERAQIVLELSGETITASWDPRTSGDHERSGVIRVGRAILAAHVTAGPPRRIETTAIGYRIS